MFTYLFTIGYISLILILLTIESIYWVYTGTSSIAWAEHLLGILIGKLFLQIIIPCVFLDIIIPIIGDMLDNLKKICYNRNVNR